MGIVTANRASGGRDLRSELHGVGVGCYMRIPDQIEVLQDNEEPVVVSGAKLAGAEPGKADVPAAAVELIHAYSLVHDDLPAMDDDDLRRGQPTCHKAFDEATAILAGDTLHTRAFELLASGGHYRAETRIAMIRHL